MSNKKAFIFDTNFILQNKDLTEVVKRLGNSFVVYATQLSIEERFSQEYIEMQKKYKQLDSLKDDFKGIADISVKETFEQKYQKRQLQIKKGYSELFADKVIPFSKDAQTFEAVWDRIHKKLPPFRAIPGSGDKGFKDALLWITILGFFKKSGELEVLFLTDDKDFLDNASVLEDEFNKLTGKKIEIKNNNFYKSFVDGHSETPETIACESTHDNLEESIKENTISRPPLTKKDLDELRVKIKNAIGGICKTEIYGNNNYDSYEEKNFILKEKIDEFQARDFILGLRKAVDDHLLHDELDAVILFSNAIKVESGQPISIQSLEFVIEVFDEVLSKMPQQLDSFYKVVSDILNKNYVEIENLSRNPFEDTEDNDDLPF